MALPTDSLTFPAQPAPFLPPRDRPKIANEDWTLGGIALNDASRGLDTNTWRFAVDQATGVVSIERDGEVVDAAWFTIPGTSIEDDIRVEDFAASFDTNMQPVLGWTMSTGESFFRWFDPTIPAFDTIALASGSYCVRIVMDDPRVGQNELRDTIIAYVRNNRLYYRQLRDRFATEYLLAGSGGMSYLYQIGMNTLLRMQFSRSGQFEDEPRNLHLPIPSVRAGAQPLVFDSEGNLTRHPHSSFIVHTGPKGSDVYRSAVGSTYHLQDHDGSWAGAATRGAAGTFFRLPSTSLGTRSLEWTRDNRGALQLVSDTLNGESLVSFREAARLGTLTGMLRDALGNGRAFSVVSITEGPAFGSFTPNYAATGDFANGRAPAGDVQYIDHGAHVTLNLTAAHHGDSVTNALRWPAGTIPARLRPTAARSVPCIVTNDGKAAPALATVHADGSVHFIPQAADTVSDTPIVSYAIFKVGYTSTDAVAAAGPTTATTARWLWHAPAASIDWLFVGGGGRGGRGNSVPKGDPGNIAGGGGGGGAQKQYLGLSFTPGQPIVINIGRGATDNGGGTEFTAPDIFGSGKNRVGHALSRGGVTGIEGLDVYVSGGANGGHANRFPANGEPGMSPFISSVDATRAGGGGGAGNDPGDDQIGGAGSKNGGDSLNPGTNYSGGGGGGGAAAGSAGVGGNSSGSANEHGGAGGDGVSLSSLGWGDAVSEVGAPPTICAGGGGAGYKTGSVTGNGGAGGSSGVGGKGADGTGGSGAPGEPGAADTGSGGGGACGSGTPGSGANGFALARWVTAGATYGLLVPAAFTAGGTKGLPADFTLAFPK